MPNSIAGPCVGMSTERKGTQTSNACKRCVCNVPITVHTRFHDTGPSSRSSGCAHPEFCQPEEHQVPAVWSMATSASRLLPAEGGGRGRGRHHDGVRRQRHHRFGYLKFFKCVETRVNPTFLCTIDIYGCTYTRPWTFMSMRILILCIMLRTF